MDMNPHQIETILLERPELPSFEELLATPLYEMDLIEAPARTAYNLICREIEAFQVGLADDAEIGLTVAGFNSASPFRLRAFRVDEPYLILEGIGDAGCAAKLLVDGHRPNIMFTVLPAIGDTPHRLAFA